jgi:hypothetical protein
VRPTIVRAAFSLSFVAIFAAIAACHRGKPSAPPGECAKTLPSSSHAVTAASAPPPISDSKIVVRASVPVEVLRTMIESQVPKRVAAESGRSIGTAGQVTYTVDRGPFSIATAGSSIVARTDLAIHASICKPIDYVGCVQYATCDPGLRVTAAVPAQLGDDWKWKGSSVSIDVTKPCLVTALDVDVTPILVAKAREQTAGVKAKIDAALPDVKADAAHGWEVAQTNVPFGSGCFALHPTAIVQGPTTIEGTDVVARFAAIAHPSVVSPCVDPPPPVPLPKLDHDAAMGDDFQMHVAVTATTAALAEAWTQQAKASTFDAANAQLRASALDVHTTSRGLAIDLGLAGTTCGTAFFDGEPKWDATRKVIAIDPLLPATGEAQRFSTNAPDAIASLLRQRLSFTPPADDASLGKGLVDLGTLASTDDRTFDVSVAQSKEEALFATPDGVELRFEIDGKAAFHTTKLNK